MKFAWVQMLVWFYLGWCYLLARQTPPEVPSKPAVRCCKCGGTMRLIGVTDGSGKLLTSQQLPYLDSG